MKKLLCTIALTLSVALFAAGGNAQGFKIIGSTNEVGPIEVAPQATASGGFAVVSPWDNTEPVHLQIETLEAFVETLTLSSEFENKELPPGVLNRLTTRLSQGSGLGVIEHIDYDPTTKHIFGAPGLKLKITNHYTTSDGSPAFVLEGRDSSTGQMVDMTGRQIAVMGPDGKVRTYGAQSFTAARAPMVVSLLIDASGSMDGHMMTVIRAAKELIRRLPSHVTCKVIMFGGQITDLGNGPAPCELRNFDFSQVKAGGGTPLFAALRGNLQAVNAGRYAHHQAVTLVLTDGRPGDLSVQSSIPPLKQDTVTMFFWLGDKGSDAEDLLRPYADRFVSDAKGAVANLNQYLGVVAENAKRQTVIVIKPLAVGQRQ